MARADLRTDVAVAVGTAVVSLGLVFGVPPLEAMDHTDTATSPPAGSLPWAVLVVALLAGSAALLRARRAPRATLVATACIALAAASTPNTLHGLVMLPVVVAVVLASVRVPLASLWPGVVAAAVLVVGATAVNDAVVSGSMRGGVAIGLVGSGGAGVLQAVGAVGLPLLVAQVVRSRRETRAARSAEATARTAEATARNAEATAREAEADAVMREHDARVDAAVGRERTAMARELHDIAAHHLSGIAIMSAVVDRQIDTDPAAAHEGVRQVREQSTAVLEDLRRLVGLLREDGPAERTVETVAGIVDLVERSRTRAEVRLDVRATADRPLADGIGPLAQLAAYRTVQESLANAAMHAPGAPVTVTIDDRDPGRLLVRVENGAPDVPAIGGAAAGGNGLRGMRERADLVGAGLQAGPRDGGGWRVDLAVGREARVDPATPATDPTGAPR